MVEFGLAVIAVSPYSAGQEHTSSQVCLKDVKPLGIAMHEEQVR